MATALGRLLIKPRDTVETPTGRVGMVMDVLPEHRREIQLRDGGSVILKDALLKVLVSAIPRPWQEKIKP